jgi:hypothetical protein
MMNFECRIVQPICEEKATLSLSLSRLQQLYSAQTDLILSYFAAA